MSITAHETLNDTHPLTYEQVSNLLKERDKIDTRYDEVDHIINEFADTDPEAAEAFDRAYEEAVTVFEAGEIKEDEITPWLLRRTEGLIPQHVSEALEARYDIGREALAIETQLDKGAGKELNAYVRILVGTLLTRINHTLLAQLVKKNTLPPSPDGILLQQHEATIDSPGHIIFVLNDILQSKEDETYSRGELRYDYVERAEQILEKWGVLDKGGSAPGNDYDKEELARAYELNNAYRTYHNELDPQIAREKNYLPVHEWGIYLDDEGLIAQSNHLYSIDIEKLIDTIEIDIQAMDIPSLTIDDVKNMMRLMPPITFEGIHKISFRPQYGNVIHDDVRFFGRESVMIGYHAHDLHKNSAEIVVITNALDFLRDPSHDELAARVTEVHILKSMATNFIHESAHALHHKMPVSLLHMWDNVARAEKVDVTDYVAATNRHKLHNYKMEDFADSVKLFITDPVRLKRLAPNRFAAICKLFLLTTPDESDR